MKSIYESIQDNLNESTEFLNFAKTKIDFKKFDKQILEYIEKQLIKELGSDWKTKSLIDIEDITYNAIDNYCTKVINDDTVSANKYYEIVKKFIEED